MHSTRSLFNSLVMVDADTYVLAYEGSGDDGFIKTFDVADGTVPVTLNTFSVD